MSYNINMLREINKIIFLLINFFILTIITFVSVYFALFPKGDNVFALPKVVLFKVLVLLLLLFTIIKFLLFFSASKGYPVSMIFLKNIGIGYLRFLFLLFFLLALSLSALFSPWAELSFYGTYSRQMGLVSYIYFFLFFVLLLVNIRTRAQIEWIIKAAVWGSVAVCAYGLVQAAGQDPLHWIESTRLRITSTFGQPNILAAYLLLVIPLSVYLIWQVKKWWIKAIYFLIFTCQILTLFFTYSFSGWLGLIGGVIIGGIIFLLFYFNKMQQSSKGSNNDHLCIKQSKFSSQEGCPPDVTSGGRGVFLFLKKKALIIILFVSLLLIALVFGFNLYKHQPWVLKSKIHCLFNPTTGSLSARIDFWRASLAAIKKRPLLGYGPDTQGEALLSYYEKDWATVNKVNVRPNRAHNLFLDILLTTGILGLIVFFALLYIFFKMLWQNIKNDNSRALNIAIFFALLSYLIYLMFNFSSVTTEIYFWFYLALVMALYRRQVGEALMFIEENAPLADRPFFQRYIVTSVKIILIIVFTAGILWQFNQEVKVLAADHYWYTLRNIRWADNDFFASWVLFNYIKDLNIRDDYYQKQYALMLANWVPNLDQYGLIFRRVAKERILPTILPILKTGQTYDDYLTRGKVYAFLASEQQPEYYQLAQSNLEKLIDLSPNRPRPYLEIARFLTKKEDYEQAEKNYYLALTKLPDFSNPRLDADHKKNVENEMHLIYYGLGNLYSKKKDYKKAIEYYRLAQNYNQYDLSVLRALARVYHQQGDIEQAIWYNKKGMEVTPDYDWSWPLALTRLYNELGDKEKTRQYAQKVLEFYPQNQEVRELLSQ